MLKAEPGQAQKAMTPVINELARNGHVFLAFKHLYYATKMDMQQVMNDRARRRRIKRTLENYAMTFKLEAEACNALNHHHDSEQ